MFLQKLVLEIVILLCVIKSARSVRLFFVARASSKWPTAAGKIIHVAINESTRQYARGGGSYELFTPVVSYSYVIGQKSYRSETVSFRKEETRSYEKAMGTIGNLQSGQDIAIYYDPANPDRSVLYPGYDSSTFEGLFASGFFGILCAIALAAIWSK